VHAVAVTATALSENPRGTDVRIDAGHKGAWMTVRLDDQGIVEMVTGHNGGRNVALMAGLRHRLGQNFVVTVDGVSSGFNQSARAIDAVVHALATGDPGTNVEFLRNDYEPLHRSYVNGQIVYGAESLAIVAGDGKIQVLGGEQWFGSKILEHPTVEAAMVAARAAQTAPAQIIA
jgi:hypothetical protein